MMTLIAGLVMAMMFLAGWLAGTAWNTYRGLKKTEKRVAAPLYVSNDNEGEAVNFDHLSIDEMEAVLLATESFTEQLLLRLNAIYIPDSSEQAQADITLEGSTSEDGAELGQIEWESTLGCAVREISRQVQSSQGPRPLL